MTHFLKVWPGSFEAVILGTKRHDIRRCDDRKFLVNDFVVLEEWNPAIYMESLKNSQEHDPVKAQAEATKAAYTGRRILRIISYVSVAGSWGLPSNICVFTIK